MPQEVGEGGEEGAALHSGWCQKARWVDRAQT